MTDMKRFDMELDNKEAEFIIHLLNKEMEFIDDTKGEEPEFRKENEAIYKLAKTILEKIRLAGAKWEFVADGLFETHIGQQMVLKMRIKDTAPKEHKASGKVR